MPGTATFGGALYSDMYDLSEDGQQFLITSIPSDTPSSEPITVVLN